MPKPSDLLFAAGNALAGSLLDSTRAVAPIFNGLEAYDLIGTAYRSVAIGSLPSAGGFRYVGEGGVASSASYVFGKVEAARLYPVIEEERSQTDLMNADVQQAIANGQVPDWLTLQLQTKLRVELEYLDKQTIKGLSNDAKGFIGLRDCVDCTAASNVLSTTENAAGSNNYTKSAINAGGSTANTGSRVYLVMQGLNGVCFRVGGPTGLAGFLAFEPVTIHRDKYTDPLDSVEKVREIYHTAAEGYIGLSVFGDSRGTGRSFTQRVLRVGFNVTEDVGKTCSETFLDAMINSLPPESRGNMAFIMSGRSRRQLRDSKTGNGQVNINLAAGDAAMRTFTTIPDLPDTHRGIPIIESDHIADTDAIITPA